MRVSGFVALVLFLAAPLLAQERYLDSGKRYQVPVAGAPSKGANHAKVTIVEFSDFHCPRCSDVEATLAEVWTRYEKDLRIVYRQLPLWEDSLEAAEASLAAEAQGKFWAFHDHLFASPTRDRSAIESCAEKAGMDLTRLRKELEDGVHRARIEEDLALAERLGVGATPMFFINGRPFLGAQPLESFVKVIAEELAHVRTLSAQEGTFYEEVTRNGEKEASLAPPGPDPLRVYSIPIADSPSRGPKDAKVTIVEFGDFECGFCARAQATLGRVVEEYASDVRVVWKHMPLKMHENAARAAEAALAAGAQGKFWEMHDRLLSSQALLSDEDLERYGAEIGLDMLRFRLSLGSGRYRAALERDLELGRTLNIRGTPTFFVNGRIVSGAVPFAILRDVVEEEKAKAEEMIRSGVSAKSVYATICGLVGDRAPRDAPADAELAVATLMACHGRDEETAKKAYSSLRGSRRAWVRKECKVLGVRLAP